ncbi:MULTISPECIES: RICIN domain-containing protein [unclassified Crossiella]|uniref:RICIN domain-containing protein n=1 Tax=unclassified Crossiella TaxID=2620835 RepID=UPI001FFFB74F|nr:MULTISPECIES: RICIN domain-containing protein [unclassified Crossiella]MCK2239164.1 ricin-type beta-trefoil lectin domain protein [Crossiella sp. S99.2]MCK2251267.1 ricin-type beta-trefoil lectin domain protein [Crossiella sp. S99.1]
MQARSRVLGIALALVALTSTPTAAAGPAAAGTTIRAGNAIGPCMTQVDDVVRLLPCIPVFANSARWVRSGGNTIVNTRTGDCLEINHNPVQALRCKPWNFLGQTWDPRPDGKILYRNSTFCLTANHDARVADSTPCNGSPQQTWLFRF